LVQSNGAKYWRMKYRLQGREKLLALGVYPDVSLKDARAGRDKAKALLKEGVDPIAERREQTRLVQAVQENTFEAIGREWLESRKAGWTKDHSARVLQSLAADIFPGIGARPIAELSASELLTALRNIEARGALELAARVLQRCGSVFRYAIATGRCQRNPATDLRGALKTAKKENYAALDASELPEYLRKLADYDGHVQTKLALRLLALTFVRTGELRGAQWPEFDLEAAEWRIPAERMKMKAAHIVPLSSQAIEVIEQLRALNGYSKWVFPNQASPQKCMSENTMLYALYRMGYHSRATGHGFRTTASTILNETGFRADAIERQLAHAERNKVRGAYNKAEYLPERRKMMQAWADMLDAMDDGGKVVIGKFNRAA
jgi:integrase